MQVIQQRRKMFPATLFVFIIAVFAGMPSGAQDVPLDKEAYLTPPKVIADVIRADRDNVALTNLSPDGKKFLITKSDGLPTLERMARPCVHLGEMAFDPVAHRAHLLYVRSNVGYELFCVADKRKVAVEIPAQARVSNPAWSPDGGQLAFYAHFPEATHIYVADTVTGKSRQLTETPVLATLVTAFQWSKDGKRIQTLLLPAGAEVLKPSTVAGEPKVRIALEGKLPSRTFRYLLESPYEMKLFEHLITGQLAFINVNDGKVAKVGSPSMIRQVSMAPSGQQFRVTTVKKPFSYYVPADRFGSVEGIWDHEGKMLYTLGDKKLREIEPQAPGVTAAPTGKGFGFGKKGIGTATPPADPANPPDGQPADPEASAVSAGGPMAWVCRSCKRTQRKRPATKRRRQTRSRAMRRSRRKRKRRTTNRFPKTG